VTEASGERARLLIAAPLAVEAIALRAHARGVRVVRTGMGWRRAARAAARLAREPADAIAVAGVCGALDPSLAPGDLVVATELVGPDGSRIPTPHGDALAAALASAGLRVSRGAIAGVAKLRDGSAREALARRTGACAVDMESFWLAAAAAGRPFAVLRSVSDGPRHPFFRPHIVAQGIAALRALRAAAPALAAWADAAPSRAPAPGRGSLSFALRALRA
jgi:4-hydroxy-3-methylbut-2-enyl diphosphate reductase